VEAIGIFEQYIEVHSTSSGLVYYFEALY
jgi:hypothetical protein